MADPPISVVALPRELSLGAPSDSCVAGCCGNQRAGTPGCTGSAQTLLALHSGSDVAPCPCGRFLWEEMPQQGSQSPGCRPRGWCGWGGRWLAQLWAEWALMPDVSPDLCTLLPLQSRLHQNCSDLIKPINDSHSLNDTTWCDWAPFGRNRASCSCPRKRLSRARKGFLQGPPSTSSLCLPSVSR